MKQQPKPIAQQDNAVAVKHLVELLRIRAQEQPHDIAYRFLSDGVAEGMQLSFGELDQRARAIAAHLQTMSMAGQRALLLYPPGLPYIAAFFGCLYAKVVAVPAYPPSRHHLNRLQGIVEDAAPALVMTTEELQEKLLARFSERWGTGHVQWLVTDTVDKAGADGWLSPNIAPSDLAFLQYTSGSTGHPKGVMVSHQNLLANQHAIKESFHHTEKAIVVGWLPLYHDMGLIGNILQPLYLGTKALLMSPLTFMDQPVRWLQAISRYRATTSGGPNVAYELCLRKITAEQKRDLDLSTWTVAFNGAEPVRATTIERFSAAFAECGFRREAFFPCYGLAEATLFVTGPVAGSPLKFRPAITPAEDSVESIATLAAEQSKPLVGCGQAWTDHAVKIVDPVSGQACSESHVGEIWVAGPSVAQGYWNQPEESARVFRARLAGDGGKSLLRTGDLGFLHQGELYVTGRIKDLIIIRGRNYYPQDLEQALDEHVEALRTGCNAAFSVILENEEHLVVVAEVTRDAMRKNDYPGLLAALRRILAEDFELAAADLVLVHPGAVPKTSSGKIRRSACRQAYLKGSLPVLACSGRTEATKRHAIGTLVGGDRASTATQPGLQFLREALSAVPRIQRPPLIARFLANTTARLLKLDVTSLADEQPLRSFGLDSLKAVELKHDVDKLLGIEAPLTLFLSDLSVKEVADCLAETWGIPVSESEVRESANDALPLHATDSEDCNLSYTQQAIWAVQHRELDSPVYNLQVALRIDGEFDVQVFEQALRLLLERHEILRTVYRTEGDGVLQKVLPVRDLQDWFSVIEAMEWSESDLQQDLVRRGMAPFDLAFGPVLRVAIYRQGPGKHSLLFCVHHIAVDLWSVMLLLEELRELYEGVTAGHPVKPIAPRTGYHEFARWQRTYADSAKGASAWEYWRDQLAGTLPVLALPIDYSRPVNPNYRGSSRVLHVRPELADRLRKVGEVHGATIFATLLAAYSVLLHRYTHQGDIIIGTASSGRSRAGFAEIIGNCVNPLAIRSFPAGGETFATHLRKVKGTLLDALEHQDFPFSVLVERLQPSRASGHWPLFQTLFVYRTEQSGIAEDLASVTLGEQGAKVGWGDWTIEPINLRERGETFDLALTVAELGEGILASFHYRSDLFAPETIARMAGHFETLLEGIVENDETHLSELSLLRPAERQQLLVDWSSSRAVHPQEYCLHRLFEIQVQKTPGVEAVMGENDRLTYAELNAEANRLAHHLRSRGVGSESRVGLCVERSPAMVIGMLGILKAGGAYVPVDPCYPRARIEYLLADSGARILLTQAQLLESVPSLNNETICLDRDWNQIAGHPEIDLMVPVDPDNVAYVIYTSGSTGRPKGVLVSHRNAVHSTSARFVYYPEAVVRFLLLPSFAFDSSVAGVFWNLGQGGTLVLPKEGIQKDPKSLAESIASEGISHLLCLPSLYGLLLEQAARLGSLRTVIVAGEACPRDVAIRHLKQLPETRLYNEYGPTEGTVWSSVHEITARDIEAERPIAIGRPAPGCRIYLLDAALNPVPVGVSGELYIGGAGVTRGYLNHPELTAQRFVPNPFAGEGSRLYKTGDLVRWRPDGNLEFLGRVDHQVKIRGFRIEPEEIEARLLAHPGVKEAIAVVREDVPGDKRLAAYVVPRLAYAPVIDGHVRYSLPSGMAIVQYEPGETDYLYRQIFEDQGYLRHGIQLRDGDFVFDVGANIGMFTLFVNHYFPNARVFAFEPIPAVFECLRLNAKLYGANTTVLPCGLSDQNATVPFTFYPKSSLMSGRYADRQAERRVVKSYIQNRERRDFEDVEAQLDILVDGRLENETLLCPVRTLSEVIREHGVERIDFLKIDVERSKLEVLQGIKADDWARIRQIVLEVEDGGGRLDRITALLRNQGYAMETEQEPLLRGTPIYNIYAIRVAPAADTEAASPSAVRYPVSLSTDELRQFLKERLPDYMVPSAFMILENLPLTPNGKIDRKTLPVPDIGSQLAQQYEEPRNAVEETLAVIWKEVLRIEKVGIHDNFFELGGDSILSIQVASRAIDAGLDISPALIFDHPTIAGLATVAVQVASTQVEPGPVSGDVPSTPIQRWFFEQNLPNPHHWNQAIVLECRAPLDPIVLKRAIYPVVFHHDALRLRFIQNDAGWRQYYAQEETHAVFHCEDLSGIPDEDLAKVIEARSGWWQTQLDIAEGPLLQVVLFDLDEHRPSRLLIAMHHLVVDGVSWRILLDDLQRVYHQLAQGHTVTLPPKTTSFKHWAEQLQTLAQSEALKEEETYWLDATAAGIPALPVDDADGTSDERNTAAITVELSEAETQSLCRETPAAYRSGIDDLLLTALVQTLGAWSRSDTVVFDWEGHGREDLFEEIDLSRTVGWFTRVCPVRLHLPKDAPPVAAIRAVKEQLRHIPRKGIGYGLLRYQSRGEVGERLKAQPAASVLFNYLGQLDQTLDGTTFTLARESTGLCYDPNGLRAYELEVNAQVAEARLRVEWRYGGTRYRETTVVGLAEHYLSALRSLIAHCLSPQAGGFTPSDFPLATLTQAELDALPCDPRTVEDLYPLSPMQEGMLFHTLMAPHSGIYLVQDRFDVQGHVDVAAFRDAWQRIVDRHPALRASFLWELSSRPHQLVHREARLPFEYLDWRGFDKAEQRVRLDRLLQEEIERGFDLSQAPLMRIRLLRLGESRYRFVHSYHHILVDAWCISLILTELKAQYAALLRDQSLVLPPPPPFRVYLAWLARQDETAAERFWQKTLQGFTEPTPLALPAPDSEREEGVADAVTRLGEEDTRELLAFAQRHRLTPNTFVQAAWALTLMHYSGRDDVLFGITVAGRPTDLSGSEQMLGMFINSLPLRIGLKPNQRILEFMASLVAQNLDMRRYEYLPLLRVQALSEVRRERGLFDTLLVFENYPIDPSLHGDDGELYLTGVEVRTHNNYPLTVTVVPGAQLEITFTYQRERFERRGIERLLDSFRHLLNSVILHPDARLAEIPLLTEAERRRIEDWNRTERAWEAPRDFVARFEAQVLRSPDAVAGSCGEQAITYAALAERAGRIASRLRSHGVGPETLVAILDERGLDFLTAILGVFKAGGAYLPLDSTHPDARLREVLKDSGAAMLLMGTGQAPRTARLLEGLAGLRAISVTELELSGGPDEGPCGNESHLAYVIYTSGSTGRPKGVMVERRGMLNNLLTKISALGLSADDIVAQTASQCFDISVWQFLTPLLCGAQVRIFPDAVTHDPWQLVEQVKHYGVTVLESVPSLIRAILDLPAIALTRLRWLLPTGEALPPELCRRWQERYPHVALLNAYGPAECSDDVAYYPVPKACSEAVPSVPIGRPVDNTRLYLLGRWLNPVPVGLPGQICVAGTQIGRGYLHRPDLTAAAFIPDPFSELGERLYCTGDLGRYRADGRIEYLGRVDHQVKLRGFRIEPGEIEARLRQHPSVREAVVIARADTAGAPQLVAYFISSSDRREDLSGGNLSIHEVLRAFLRETLPDYMVPAAFVMLEQLPLTPNGKVDRKALPEPDTTAQLEEWYVAPGNPTEEILAGIWQDVLGVGRVGIRDNFFDLGGHSLSAVRVLSRLRTAFGVDIPLRRLFETSTIEQLAIVIEELLIEQMEGLSDEEARTLLQGGVQQS